MEVAGQWRREWAGTAEYGKVTEGGVTRHVARAMEVLHASAPGARVRVMRAAYHSSAGPGLPAVSSMMHSSRRVISSGFNLLESPTTPIKPLEISSTPLDSTPEYNTEHTDTENYEVTEPDDFEISEPSKWKSSTGGNSIRMPSEESSSTDNASIIDLDSRFHRNVFRKHSYDSENSDVPLSRKISSRLSPLLDAPVALSTLKYKSLLNGSNDWTNRRKSYSFEDTSPLDETITHSNDTLAMESSTDSGICKSTEIVNEPDDKFIDRKHRNFDRHEETFKDWLSKNRSTSSFYKPYLITPRREHDVVIEEPLENNITLQSKGKVTITVPIKVETDEEYQYRKNYGSEDGDRKVKKVGFCKTELHFAAETGKVNIIATDEKPPPTNDFRKRRSAFVPIHGNFEKPITLFGEANKDFPEIKPSEFLPIINNETGEIDENTAATKSILKNRIPKPKPYLLGENMVFGSSDDDVVNKTDDTSSSNKVPTAVSLINRQLQERRYSNETTSSDTDIGVIKNNAFRTTSIGPQINDTLKLRKAAFEVKECTSTNNYTQESFTNSVKNKLRTLQMSPLPRRAKTRQLRDSDLTYFGVDNSPKQSRTETPKYVSGLQSGHSSIDDIFQSVKLIQKVSNSVCNSEAESEDAPEYQNIPFKTNYTPVPTPRTRSKYDYNLIDPKETKILKPVIEQADEANIQTTESRRSRVRRHEDSTTFSNRSISAPPKSNNMYISIEKPRTQHKRAQVSGKMSPSPRSKRSHFIEGCTSDTERTPTPRHREVREVSEEKEPLYVNLNAEEKKMKNCMQRTDSIRRKLEGQQKAQAKVDTSNSKRTDPVEIRKSRSNRHQDRSEHKVRVKSASRVDTDSLEKKEDLLKKTTRVKRTEKLSTPDYPNDKIYNSSSSRRRLSSEKTDDHNKQTSKQDHRSRSGQRHSTKESGEKNADEENKQDDRKDSKHQTIIEEVVLKSRTRNLSKDKTGSRNETTKAPQKIASKPESAYNSTNSKGRDEIISEKVPNGKPDSRASKRSEYVINYDDKNGTVSSICKVSGSSTSKKKKAIKRGTDIPKENKMKNKTSEKIALLQLPEHHWDPYGMSYADRKRKRKMHVQRTCQLL